MRVQKIILENGMEVYIDHDNKDTCQECKKDIVWAHVPVELVSLARWDLHKCEVKDEKN